MLMVGFSSGLFRCSRSQGNDVNGRLKSAANPCGLRKSTEHIYLYRFNCSDGPCGFKFFTFSPHLLKIAGMLPMVYHFVTRIVPE
ncbi:hypothetical protein Hanom_Chr17g01545201 [Helianthus anomalus]